MSVILTLLWPGTGGQKWKNNVVLKILHFHSNYGFLINFII